MVNRFFVRFRQYIEKNNLRDIGNFQECGGTLMFIMDMHIPLERNSLSASAGRLSAPNGKLTLNYTGLRMFLPFNSRRNAL